MDAIDGCPNISGIPSSRKRVLQLVKELVSLQHGADVEAKNNYGKTAFQVAAEEGHGEVVELLREHGA